MGLQYVFVLTFVSVYVSMVLGEEVKSRSCSRSGTVLSRDLNASAAVLHTEAWSSQGAGLPDISVLPANDSFHTCDSSKDVLMELKTSLGEGAEFIYDKSREIIEIQEGSNGGRDIDCCPTITDNLIIHKMVDYTGRHWWNIAQVEDVGSDQWVYQARCGPKGQSCPGTCVLVNITLSLAVIPPAAGQTVTFKRFQVPGYCVNRLPMHTWLHSQSTRDM